MISDYMKRVTKSEPCPICTKSDWCLYAEDGSAAICARTEQGSTKRCGDAGWLHILRDNRIAKIGTYKQRLYVDTGDAKGGSDGNPNQNEDEETREEHGSGHGFWPLWF